MNQQSNTDIIEKVIKTINENFANSYLQHTLEILKKYNIKTYDKNLIPNDPYFYYLNGHCNSYSDILCSIFGENAIKYNSESHVITKIGVHFYDVTGIVDYLVDEKFHKTDTISDLHYIDIAFYQNDEMEKPIEIDLINIGIKKLEELKSKEIKQKQKTI